MSNRLARRADRLASLPPAVLPPEPPERAGRPIRVHIEIVLHRAPPAPRPGLGLLWWVLFGLIAWSLIA